MAVDTPSNNSSSMPSSLSEIPARTRSALLQSDLPASPSFSVDLVIGFSTKLSVLTTGKLPKTVRDTQLKDRSTAATFAQTEYASLLARLKSKGLRVTTRKAKVEVKKEGAKGKGEEDDGKVWVFVSATEEMVQELMEKERSVQNHVGRAGAQEMDEGPNVTGRSSPRTPPALALPPHQDERLPPRSRNRPPSASIDHCHSR